MLFLLFKRSYAYDVRARRAARDAYMRAPNGLNGDDEIGRVMTIFRFSPHDVALLGPSEPTVFDSVSSWADCIRRIVDADGYKSQSPLIHTTCPLRHVSPVFVRLFSINKRLTTL